jgi:O-antigen/teichoic acid export membrane protein
VRGFRQSLKWAFVGNWGERAIGTVFTFVLAALLGPRDFGLVAMALIYVAFLQLFLEQGISTAIIQRERLDREHIDSAFWLNLVWCVALAAGSVLAAGWWAGANHAPALERVIEVLSLLLVIDGLAIVQIALLQREMRFKTIAVQSNVSWLAGGVVGLVLALSGAGVWALVAQQLVIRAMMLVIAWAVSGWFPRLRFSLSHARELLGYSANVFVANVGGFVNRRADALLLGLFFGPAAVGLYRLADRLVDNVLELAMRPIGVVSLPVFSRLQNDPEGLRRSVATCLRTTLLATLPVMLVLASCSDYVLAVIGPEWKPAADALKLLCVVGIAKGFVFFTGPLLFAVSRPRFRAIMLWVLGAVSAAVVVAVGSALDDSAVDDQLVGMAASRALLFVLVFVPINVAIIVHLTGLRVRELLPGVPAPLASGLAAFGGVTGVAATGVLDGLRPLPALVVAGTLASVLAVVVLVLLDARVRGELSALWNRLWRRSPAAVGTSS